MSAGRLWLFLLWYRIVLIRAFLVVIIGLSTLEIVEDVVSTILIVLQLYNNIIVFRFCIIFCSSLPGRSSTRRRSSAVDLLCGGLACSVCSGFDGGRLRAFRFRRCKVGRACSFFLNRLFYDLFSFRGRGFLGFNVDGFFIFVIRDNFPTTTTLSAFARLHTVSPHMHDDG